MTKDVFRFICILLPWFQCVVFVVFPLNSQGLCKEDAALGYVKC